MSNTVFTNITCKLKNVNDITYLRFPKTKELLNLGTYLSKKDSLATVEVIPYYGKFKVIITLGNAPKKITLKEKKEQEELKYKNAKRIFSIDLGVNNFVTISNNIETVPIVIKGKFIKSFNQYFNSKRAFLVSELTKGSNNYYIQTKALNNLSRKRENFFKDTFYKISHFILNECKIYNIDTVVIGKNDGWKQNINTGKVNNQNFVNIPFNKFITILTYILEKNNINVIEKEESYTSKASFLDNDDIPTYKEGDTTKYIFSGKRIERGLYKTNKGILINADINGASNILKKAIPNAFNNISDFSYLYKTIKVINFNDIYKQGEIKPNAKKTLSIKTINKRIERRYNLIYYKKRNKRYKELKQVFQVILDRCGNEPLVK